MVQNTYGWLLLFYKSCFFYNLQLYFFYTDIFSIFFDKCTLSNQRFGWLGDTELLTNFENLNSVSNIFPETHDFLVLMDPVIISIYLRTTDRHFYDHGIARHSTSKLLKCDLVQTLGTFRNSLPCMCSMKERYNTPKVFNQRKQLI